MTKKKEKHPVYSLVLFALVLVLLLGLALLAMGIIVGPGPFLLAPATKV